MKLFKTLLKGIRNHFNPIISVIKKADSPNKGKKCVIIPGLHFHSEAELPKELVDLIAASTKVEGMKYNFTPSHLSEKGVGSLYFGPQSVISDEDIDGFEM